MSMILLDKDQAFVYFSVLWVRSCFPEANLGGLLLLELPRAWQLLIKGERLGSFQKANAVPELHDREWMIGYTAAANVRWQTTARRTSA